MKSSVSVVDKASIQSAVLAQFSAREEIAGIYLFGSLLGRAFNQDSDVDIALLFKENHLPSREKLEQDRQALEARFNRPVDLVVLNTASPILNYQILKTGACILKKQDSLINQFFVRTINDYFDLKAVRAPIERKLKQVTIL